MLRDANAYGMLFTLAFNPDSFELRILVFNVFGALRS
jgi:hypothetical protein